MATIRISRTAALAMGLLFASVAYGHECNAPCTDDDVLADMHYDLPSECPGLPPHDFGCAHDYWIDEAYPWAVIVAEGYTFMQNPAYGWWCMLNPEECESFENDMWHAVGYLNYATDWAEFYQQ